MQPVLHPVRRNQLHVHHVAEDPSGHGRNGPFRHERVLCVPPLVGHSARAVRGDPGEWMELLLRTMNWLNFTASGSANSGLKRPSSGVALPLSVLRLKMIAL